jgi:hypothetical protein
VNSQPPSVPTLTHPLDHQTLDGLADLICGDADPWYRHSWQLEQFFRGLSVTVPPYDGPSRKRWTLAVLEGLRNDLDAQERVLLRLADPREYKSDEAQTREATVVLNYLLMGEGLRLEHHPTGPRLARVDAWPIRGVPDPVELAVDLKEVTGDPLLGELLERRWREAERCADAGAYLAAIILLGSVLEGVLIASECTHPEQAGRTPAAQTQRRQGHHRDTWMLNTHIEIARQCGWISDEHELLSRALKQYRNLVHPNAELKHRRKYGDEPLTKDLCRLNRSLVATLVNHLHHHA